MNSISVNLLPSEILLQKKHKLRLIVANRLSVAVLTLLIFSTSALLAMRISQGTELAKARQEKVSVEGKVSGLKNKEDQIITLKQRLGEIQTLLSADKIRKAMFNLFVSQISPDVSVTEISVDKNGAIDASLASSSLTTIENLIAALADKEKNADLVAKIDLERFSLGRSGVYYFDLKVSPKLKK